jgi:hypothetical protein
MAISSRSSAIDAFRRLRVDAEVIPLFLSAFLLRGMGWLNWKKAPAEKVPCNHSVLILECTFTLPNSHPLKK